MWLIWQYGSAVFTPPRSHDTALSGPAFRLALSDFGGHAIPGTADLLGHTCYCTGTPKAPPSPLTTCIPAASVSTADGTSTTGCAMR